MQCMIDIEFSASNGKFYWFPLIQQGPCDSAKVLAQQYKDALERKGYKRVQVYNPQQWVKGVTSDRLSGYVRQRYQGRIVYLLSQELKLSEPTDSLIAAFDDNPTLVPMMGTGPCSPIQDGCIKFIPVCVVSEGFPPTEPEKLPIINVLMNAS